MEVTTPHYSLDLNPFPHDWSVRCLGDIGKWYSGGTPSMANDAYWSGEIPWVSPKDMKVPRLYDAIDHISDKAVSDGTRLLPAGTVLMVIRGMILAHSFPVARAERELAFNQDMKAVVVHQDIDSNFLLHWLNSNANRLRGLTTESTHGTKRLAPETLYRVPVPLPPTKAEQEAIAEALSDADALIESLEQLVAKKRQIKHGAMQELLTGKRRLPGFAGEWDVKRIGEVADVKTGPFGSALHERDYVQDGTPIITVEHLGEMGVNHVNLPLVSDFDRRRLGAYSLEVSDIVFSRVGSVDRNALIREPESGWLFSGRLLRLRFDRTTAFAPFLSHYFHTDPFKERVRSVAVGQTMTSLNTRILSGVSIQLPELSEQIAIAAILSDMDAEIAALEDKLAKARQIKQGMMQELLTGRTRLV